MMLNSIISWIVNKLWEGHWYWWSEHTEFNRARYRSGSHFLSSQINPFFEKGYIFRGGVLVFFWILLFYSWLFDKEPKLCWLVTIVCEQTNKNRFFLSRNTYWKFLGTFRFLESHWPMIIMTIPIWKICLGWKL